MPPMMPPPGVNLHIPSLTGWAKEQTQRGNRYEESSFDQMDDPLGMGLSTLHNLPPPPRSAPAAEAASGYGGGGHGGLGGGPGGDPVPSRQFNLTVLTSDSKWETLNFSSHDDLDRHGSAFLREKGLKAAFQSGLVQKMRSMISSSQTNSSVDIVDLI